LRDFLTKRYAADNITKGEIDTTIRQLDALNAADLNDSSKTICKWVSDGFLLKREDRNQKDLYIQLVDYAGLPQGRTPRTGEVDTIVAEDDVGYGNSVKVR
jgi:type I restriction enzyme R subunit